MTSLLYPFLSALSGTWREAGSIGIIGGADGPTAIFLSSPLRYLFLLPVFEIIGILFIMIVLIYCYRTIKNKMME